MKTPARLVFLLLVGLSLTGCVSKTAMTTKPQPATKVASWSESPKSSRDYWMMRELNDKQESFFVSNGQR